MYITPRSALNQVYIGFGAKRLGRCRPIGARWFIRFLCRLAIRGSLDDQWSCGAAGAAEVCGSVATQVLPPGALCPRQRALRKMRAGSVTSRAHLLVGGQSCTHSVYSWAPTPMTPLSSSAWDKRTIFSSCSLRAIASLIVTNHLSCIITMQTLNQDCRGRGSSKATSHSSPYPASPQGERRHRRQCYRSSKTSLVSLHPKPSPLNPLNPKP